MSKVAISGNASGTGVFTIASPNSNTDRTLNLPDNSGTLLSNASTAGFPAGSVLQVVQNLNRGFAGSPKSTLLSTTSSTFANILTASITTVSANSRILVIAGTAGYGATPQRGSTRVLRGATEIDANQYAQYNGGLVFTQYQHNVLDAPGVAAGTALTYSLQGRAESDSATFGYGDSAGGPATFVTLMEIAA